MYHRAQSLPIKFLLLILKFRGAKGFEDTILPPATQKPITAMFKKKKKKKSCTCTQLQSTNSGMDCSTSEECQLRRC